MSAYVFFLSYARADYDEYLNQFVKDLVTELRRRNPFPAEQAIEFFDQPEIERGADWDAKLVSGLQGASAFVPLYSPSYFASTYSGKEWRFFHRRCGLFKGKDKARIFPSLIKPVIWIPPETRGRAETLTTELPRTVHDDVRRLQYSRGEPRAVALTQGIRHLLRRQNDPKLQREYVDYVDSLAQDILAAVPVVVPQLDPAPTLGEIDPAFPLALPRATTLPRPSATAAPSAAEPPTSRSNKRVSFVVVAASANEVPDSRDRSPYGVGHREEWQPFLPKDSQQIALVAQETALRLKLISDVLEFDRATLLKRLNRAAKDGQVVVLLVDGWTLTLGGDYFELLAKFDNGTYDNCGVLIPWNPDDANLAGHEKAVQNALQAALKRRLNVLNPLFLRMSVKSRQQLEAELEDLITRLRAAVTNSLPPVRALPPSDIEKASIRSR